MNNKDEYQPETNYEYQLRVIEELRKVAYADPQSGSDRLFAEYTRLVAMGEDGDDKKAEAIARYEEIKASLPWPVTDAQD